MSGRQIGPSECRPNDLPTSLALSSSSMSTSLITRVYATAVLTIGLHG